MDPFNFIAGFAGGLSYAVVTTLLVLCGLGIPIPEDIILVAGGYVASEQGDDVLPMMFAGLAGILAGDGLIFVLGRRFGIAMAERTFLRRFLTVERIAHVDVLFRRHGPKILLAARFTPGVRAVTYFTAGAIRLPFWKFLFFDGLAALVSAPLWVFLGYRYGHAIVDEAKRWQGYFLLAVAGLAVGLWLWRRRRGRRPAIAVPSSVGDAREGGVTRSA
jgi:membrane protein DedA with SNARE-associated domain